MGRFLSRDPVAYRAAFNLSNYVGNRPVTAYDSFGLELKDTEPVARPTTLADLMAAIHKAEGDYDLGQCFATGTWRDDGPPLTSIANRFRVSGSICGSCELVFATCRIKRRFDGVVGYWYFVIERGGLPSEFQPLINELVQNTIAEEKAHQAAAHKWLVPHEQVGFGFGCDADTAETVACLMARLLVVAFENAARKGLKEENAAIDAAGHARAGDIVQRIDELFKRLDL